MKTTQLKDGGWYADVPQPNGNIFRIYGATEAEVTDKANPFVLLTNTTIKETQ